MKSQLLFGGLPILPGSNRSSTVEFLQDPDRLLYRVGTQGSRARRLQLPPRPYFVREQEWSPCSLGSQTARQLCTNAPVRALPLPTYRVNTRNREITNRIR